jgi:hypothetical protein
MLTHFGREFVAGIREELRLILADWRALEAKIDNRYDPKGGTYFARLVLSAENELKQKRIIDIDARPFPRENKRIGTADTHSSFVGI